MQQNRFEIQLREKSLKRRVLEGAATLVFLALGIVYLHTGREIIYHEGTWFFPGWEEVRYSTAYVLLIAFSFLGAVIAGSVLVVDLMMCRFESIQKDLHRITLYRGPLHCIVYVDGTEKGRLAPFSFHSVVETKLADNVKITISFQRGMMYIAHVSFSDGTESILV